MSEQDPQNQDPQRKPFARLTQAEYEDLDRKMRRLASWRRTSGMAVTAFVAALNDEGVSVTASTYRAGETDPHRGVRLLHNRPQVYYAGQRILEQNDRDNQDREET